MTRGAGCAQPAPLVGLFGRDGPDLSGSAGGRQPFSRFRRTYCMMPPLR